MAMARFQNLPVEWRFALRELRGGLSGFRIFLACLALGVAAIAAAGSTNEAVQRGLQSDARVLLGGDLEVELTYRPPTPEQMALIDSFGRTSLTSELRTMARVDGDSTLVQLKGVDDAYPLYGAVELDPVMPLSQALEQRNGQWGAAVDPALLARLRIGIGDTIRLGNQDVEVRAALIVQPDRANRIFSFGPTVLLDNAAVDATGLVQPGTLIEYETRVATDQVEALRAALAERFPDAGWQLRGLDRAAPGFERFLGNITLFLTLVGLTALLVGGIGVANAVKAFLDSRVNTIAALKCLGASSNGIFHIYLIQIALIAALGIMIGLVLGAGVPFIASSALQGLLPVEAKAALYWWPLAKAAAFGVLTALVFALWPLSRTRAIRAAACSAASSPRQAGRRAARTCGASSCSPVCWQC